jgi:hypothetical protein
LRRFLSGREKVGQIFRKVFKTWGFGLMQAQWRGDSRRWVHEVLLTEILKIRSGKGSVGERAATYSLFKSDTSFS